MPHYFQDSETCQVCGKCCKEFVLYFDEDDNDIVFRCTLLDPELVRVDGVGKSSWRVTFKIRCSQLIERDGEYYCKRYGFTNGKRPEMCSEYPANFLDEEDPAVLEFETEWCPALKRIRKP